MSRAGEDLSRLIDEYIGASRSRSLMTLANRSGVGYTTVRRVAQREQNPSLATALSILQVVATDEQIVAFAKKHWPEQAGIIESHAKTVRDVDKTALFAALSDRESLQVLCLSTTDHGTTREDVVGVLGFRGAAKLDRLIAAGLVEEAKGRYFGKEFLLSDVRSIAMATYHSADILLSGYQEQTEAATWQTDGLNAEGIREVKKLLSEFASKLQDIRRDPKYKGSISTTAAAFLMRMEEKK